MLVYEMQGSQVQGKKKNQNQESSDCTSLAAALVLCHLFWKLVGSLLNLLLFKMTLNF